MKSTHFAGIKACLELGHFWTEPELVGEPGVKFLNELWVGLSDHAVCFNLGDFFHNPEYIEIEKEKVRLPFDVCWFETDARWGLLGAICTNIYDDGGAGQEYVGDICFSVFSFRKNKGWHLLNQGVWDGGPGCTFTKETKNNMGTAIWMLGIIGRALTALACDNIEPVEHRPSTTRKAIAKARNLPAFSTWTLNIVPCRKKGAPSGGSHKSPRFHLRRGHIRQYRPGSYVWVSSCAVGDPKIGSVEKDYSFSL